MAANLNVRFGSVVICLAVVGWACQVKDQAGQRASSTDSPRVGTRALNNSSAEPEMTADSIVMERGRCFGTCKPYRLSITRSGEVHVTLLGGVNSPTRSSRLTSESFELCSPLPRERVFS